MNTDLVQKLQDARIGLEPSFKMMRAALAALKVAERLAGEEK